MKLIPAFDAQEPAFDDPRTARHLYAGAPKRPQEIERRRRRPDRKAECAETLFDWGDGVVADPRNSPFPKVDRRERLEDVVQLRARKPDGDVLAVPDGPQVLEVSDAGLVQHDAADRERRTGSGVDSAPGGVVPGVGVWGTAIAGQHKSRHETKAGKRMGGSKSSRPRRRQTGDPLDTPGRRQPVLVYRRLYVTTSPK